MIVELTNKVDEELAIGQAIGGVQRPVDSVGIYLGDCKLARERRNAVAHVDERVPEPVDRRILTRFQRASLLHEKYGNNENLDCEPLQFHHRLQFLHPACNECNSSLIQLQQQQQQQTAGTTADFQTNEQIKTPDSKLHKFTRLMYKCFLDWELVLEIGFSGGVAMFISSFESGVSVVEILVSRRHSTRVASTEMKFFSGLPAKTVRHRMVGQA